MCIQKEIVRRVRGGLSRRLCAETRGQELVEFAMMVLVLAVLIFGIFSLGRAVSVYQALGRAAREGARVALAPSCATCGDAAQTTATVQNVVENYLQSASIDTSSMTPPTVSVQQPLDPSDPATYQVYAVSVTVQYPLNLNLPFLPNGGSFNLSSTVTMRQEY